MTRDTTTIADEVTACLQDLSVLRHATPPPTLTVSVVLGSRLVRAGLGTAHWCSPSCKIENPAICLDTDVICDNGYEEGCLLGQSCLPAGSECPQ